MQLKTLEDPTIIQRRIWLETEWNKYRDGSHDVEETLGAVWSWRLSSIQEWGVRLEVPYRLHIAGDASGDADEHGLGDLKVATATAFELGESWRASAGLELRTPTAGDELGDDDWRLQEFGAVAWDVTRWLTLSPSVEYNQSVATEYDTQSRHYLEIYLPGSFLLPCRWSVTPRYEAKVDFENDNEVIHSAKLALGKRLVRTPLGLSLSIKRSFDSGEKEFQVNLVVTYFLR